VIELLTTKCHVTTRLHDDQGQTCGEDAGVFAYSFQHVEAALETMRSEHQNLVALIFSTMFERWIRPIHGDKLTCRLSETVVRWCCEKYPPAHPLWNRSPTRTLLVLNHLFNQLLDAFKRNHLPDFFLPDNNVIPQVGRQYARKVILQIKRILDDLIAYVPDDVGGEVLGRGGEVLRVVTSSEVRSSRLREKDYTVLCHRPKLVPRLFKLFVEE